jgi:hypothetical protein
VRKGFRLEEIRAMPVDEMEAFLAIFYPQKGRTTVCKSMRQNWRKWKKPHVRHASTSRAEAQG